MKRILFAIAAIFAFEASVSAMNPWDKYGKARQAAARAEGRYQAAMEDTREVAGLDQLAARRRADAAQRRAQAAGQAPEIAGAMVLDDREAVAHANYLQKAFAWVAANPMVVKAVGAAAALVIAVGSFYSVMQ